MHWRLQDRLVYGYAFMLKKNHKRIFFGINHQGNPPSPPFFKGGNPSSSGLLPLKKGGWEGFLKKMEKC
jgi:hypothetical protein